MARSKKKKLSPRRIAVIALSVGLLLTIIGIVLSRSTIAVLQPAGPVAAGERRLLITAFLLMLIVVIPVFALTFGFAWRYRETNKKATYAPNWDHNRIYETTWWLIPSGLIVVLALITWHGTFQYDPYKALGSRAQTMHIQVVALDWRWLFIYPGQHVASINELHLPVNTPVQFDITADAPMNSFWIPQLGGQIYAMPGMGTQLNLEASKVGSYYGSSANISGRDFALMHFQAIASNHADFNRWVTKAKGSPSLTQDAYDDMSLPSGDHRVYTYSSPASNLFSSIITKYAAGGSMDTMNMEQN